MWVDFNVIEGLIHPLVLGLSFLKQNKAIMSFDEDTIYMGDTKVVLRQSPPTPCPPPPHLAAFQSVTLPPLSRNLVEVYLAGTNLKDLLPEKGEPVSAYVRPFAPETCHDVPQIAAHSIIDPRQKRMTLELLNIWPHPVNVAVDSPVALVDTINPEIKETDIWPRKEKPPQRTPPPEDD